MLHVLAEDPALANEELGEISLSEFSKGVKDGSVAPTTEEMSKEYRLVGAGRHVVRGVSANLGLTQEGNYHEVATEVNAAEIDHAEETLKKIRKDIHIHDVEKFEYFKLQYHLNGTKRVGKKVAPTDEPLLKRTLAPFFPYDYSDVPDVAADLEKMKGRYFNQPPSKPFEERDSESRDSEDSDISDEDGGAGVGAFVGPARTRQVVQEESSDQFSDDG
jgi:hypothetical protein